MNSEVSFSIAPSLTSEAALNTYNVGDADVDNGGVSPVDFRGGGRSAFSVE